MEYKRRFMAREANLSKNSSPAKFPTKDLRIDMIHATGIFFTSSITVLSKNGTSSIQ